MGIRTEDFVPELPGKEMKPGVEWLDILDSFDPQSLDEKYLKECARRNPNETCYGYEPPHRPVEERLHLAEFCTESYRNELKTAVRRIEMEGLTSLSYQNARSTLIKAIGIKGATEVVRREYNRLGEDGRKKQAEEYAAWEKELDEKSARRDKIRAIAKEHPGFASDMACDSDYYIERYHLTEKDLDELDEMVEEEEEERRKRDLLSYDHVEHYDDRDGYYFVPVLAEKLHAIRKVLHMNQKAFAKTIGYRNVNQYAKFESGKLESPDVLSRLKIIKGVCDGTGANPYWLEDQQAETLYDVKEDKTAKTIKEALGFFDFPMFASEDIIQAWCNEKRKWHII